MSTETLIPISKKERIRVIDAIRGIALFGVFLVNTVMFNATLFSFMSSPVANPWTSSNSSDLLPALFIQIFGEGKAYTIFSFLFGLGFYLFITRANAKGLEGKKLFSRRLKFLLLFGLLHFSFVWYGDILQTYALTGFLMLLFTKCKAKTLLIWATVLISFYILSFSVITLITTEPSSTETVSTNTVTTDTVTTETITSDPFNMQAITDKQHEVYHNGSFLEVVRFRVTTELFLVISTYLFFLGKILGMFLIGLYCGKKNVFENLHTNLNKVKKYFLVSLLTATITTIGFVSIQSGLIGNHSAEIHALFKALKELSIICLASTYVTGIILLYYGGKFKKLFSIFASVGQMALTNYLIQCILLSLIFYSHGLGLMEELNIFTCIGITLVFYTIQMIYSPIWLKYKKYGPFEYIWRKLTYGKT